MEQITLYYRHGSSDKIYQASIEPKDGAYVVNFAFGRRGTTLQTGTKTQTPVAYQDARKILAKLVQEKTAKGYTPGQNGAPYEHTDKEKESAGINCQLLNPVTEKEAKRLIDDPGFCMQEKMDGRRLLIHKRAGQINGINRLGLFVGLPAAIATAAERLPGDFVIDGEAIAETLHAFDLLEINGADWRGKPYEERYRQLCDLIKAAEQIAVVPTSFRQSEKALTFCTLKAMNREGVVFKKLDAPYTSGRPASGGSQFKFKFCETASFIVAGINARRSASLMLFSGDEVVPAGNVTIPPNGDHPVLGAVVEIRYLYAFKESGALFQPVYLGRRDDIAPKECVVAQLKYKPEAGNAP